MKINLCRRTPLFAAGIHCVTYLDQARFEADKDFWQRQGVDSRFILEGIDIDDNLGPPPQRSATASRTTRSCSRPAAQDLDQDRSAKSSSRRSSTFSAPIRTRSTC